MNEQVFYSNEPQQVVNFSEDPDTPPLFTGNRVLQPVVILVEGTHYGHTSSGRSVEVSYDRAYLETIAKNTRRDVPLNYDHFQGGPNYVGWVRNKTGRPLSVGTLEDGRYALFAQLELTPIAYEAVINGRYRDLSAEVDIRRKKLVGLALTNYPAVEGVQQFSTTEENMNEQVTAEFEEMKRQLQELQSKLQEERRRAERAERLLQFSQKVDTFKDKIPAGLRPLVTELYLFAAEHDDAVLQFSTNGGEQRLRPVEALDSLFQELPALALYGQVLQEASSQEPDLDEQFIGGVKAILSRKMR